MLFGFVLTIVRILDLIASKVQRQNSQSDKNKSLRKVPWLRIPDVFNSCTLWANDPSYWSVLGVSASIVCGTTITT